MDEKDRLARAAELVAAEMEGAQTAFTKLQQSAEFAGSVDLFRYNWATAARLMSTQMAAANALKRLVDRRDGFTFTYVHQGPPPAGI